MKTIWCASMAASAIVLLQVSWASVKCVCVFVFGVFHEFCLDYEISKISRLFQENR